jgi:hypothetical protein
MGGVPSPCWRAAPTSCTCSRGRGGRASPPRARRPPPPGCPRTPSAGGRARRPIPAADANHRVKRGSGDGVGSGWMDRQRVVPHLDAAVAGGEGEEVGGGAEGGEQVADGGQGGRHGPRVPDGRRGGGRGGEEKGLCGGGGAAGEGFRSSEWSRARLWLYLSGRD